VEMQPKEYIKRVEKENPVEEPWEPHDDSTHQHAVEKVRCILPLPNLLTSKFWGISNYFFLAFVFFQ